MVKYYGSGSDLMRIDNNLEIDKKIPYNICSENGQLLVGVGTPISEKMLNRLQTRKWHFENPKKYIYDNIVLLDDEFIPIIKDNDINVSRIVEKSKNIVELIKNNPVIYQKLEKIHEYDEYTYVHSTQVAYLAVAIGIKMNLSDHELINLSVASLLHDLGKCCIDKNILNKPGKLTDSEMNIMKRHPLIGYKLLEHVEEIEKSVLQMILFHHENYDGTGYPYGFSNDNISLEASIIHICDVYDALTSVRPYKPKYNELDSMNIILENSGSMFNPNIVEIFSKSIRIYSIGSVIEFSDGTKAIIKNFKRDNNGNIVELELSKGQKTKKYKAI